MHFLLFFILYIVSFTATTHAAPGDFVPLVGLPYIDNNGGPKNFGDYVKALYFASISIAALLAVVRIIFAGVKYMLTDVVTTKGQAKKDIYGALLGLLIVIGAVLILQTINPNLLVINLFTNAPVANIQTGSENIGGYTTPKDLSDLVEENDKVLWVGNFRRIKNEDDCIKNYGTFIQGSGNIADRCIIKYSTRSQALPKFAEENCPTDQTCRAELCEQQNTNIFRNCETACKNKNSILFDPIIDGCVFTNRKDFITPVKVQPGTTYYQKQNEDEIAGGYPRKKLTIIGQTAKNGLVKVRYEDGTETELSCGYIDPSPCNN